MLFLHLYCKKENFFPLTTWIFLSSLSVFLTSNLGARAYLIKQSHTNTIIKTNRFDFQSYRFNLQNQRYQLSVPVTDSRKLITLYTESIFMKALQQILTLGLFLINIPVIDTQFHNFQTQYFSNKRAPPNERIFLFT
ncbi:hypothetical protein [Bartonella rattimassiliensis]|uniref:Uncharacterized protein n=1 Tax=Bartonella rattimassiliensis 15908 TaxID=1094556 RepID=J1JK23_9HYPH|nr:hypothetical protein [Bartonella rattimassiliensis]EJF85002.1 hypothetical protein MCY_01385 [Bartonella rattimassiliensis 15908]